MKSTDKKIKDLIEEIEDILDAREAEKILQEDTERHSIEEVKKELFQSAEKNKSTTN